MPERFRTVRVRLTVAATVVAALVVLLAGLWLVRTVDGSLRDRQRTRTSSAWPSCGPSWSRAVGRASSR